MTLLYRLSAERLLNRLPVPEGHAVPRDVAAFDLAGRAPCAWLLRGR